MAAAIMKSMELDDEQKLDAPMPIPMPTKPDYPYGLRLCFDDSTLAKLGINPKQAMVGGMIHGHFIARITDVSSNENEGGENNRVESQIVSMCVESEDAENEKVDKSETRKRLYRND